MGKRNLAFAYAIATDALSRLAPEFSPECRFTLVVRRPGNTEAEFYVTDDDVEEVIAVLRRRSGDPNSYILGGGEHRQALVGADERGKDGG